MMVKTDATHRLELRQRGAKVACGFTALCMISSNGDSRGLDAILTVLFARSVSILLEVKPAEG